MWKIAFSPSTHIGSAISLDNRRRGDGGADGRPVGAVVVLVKTLSVGETLETGQPVAGRGPRVLGQRGRRHGDASALGAVAAQQTGAAGVRVGRRRQDAGRLGRRLAVRVRHHWTDGRSGVSRVGGCGGGAQTLLTDRAAAAACRRDPRNRFGDARATTGFTGATARSCAPVFSSRLTVLRVICLFIPFAALLCDLCSVFRVLMR